MRFCGYGKYRLRRNICCSFSCVDAANQSIRENNLVEGAIFWLRERMPPSWEVGRGRRPQTGTAEDVIAADARIDFVPLPVFYNPFATVR